MCQEKCYELDECGAFFIRLSDGQCYLFKSGCQLVSNTDYDYYTSGPHNCAFTPVTVFPTITELNYYNSVDTP